MRLWEISVIFIIISSNNNNITPCVVENEIDFCYGRGYSPHFPAHSTVQYIGLCGVSVDIGQINTY